MLIPEAGIKNGSILIEDVLRAFSSSQVAAMRETVIQTIPRIVYADPGVGSVEGVEDAFDIAVQVRLFIAWGMLFFLSGVEFG